MTWQLDGTYFENCSCEIVCPCTVSGLTMPADNDGCRVVLAFHVATGEIDGVDVADRTVVLVADTPPVMADGNWKLGVFLDDRGSQEQLDKLGAVFSGQMGGPMGALAPLIAEILGIETAPIEYVDDGRSHHLKVGDAIDIAIEDYVPPGSPTGEVAMLSGMAHPANTTLTIAQATRAQVTAFGLEFTNSGKNAHSAPFSWAA